MVKKYEPLKDLARFYRRQFRWNSLEIREALLPTAVKMGRPTLSDRAVRLWISDVDPDESGPWVPREMDTEDAKAVLRCLRSHIWVSGRGPGENPHQYWPSRTLAEAIAEVARFLPVNHSQAGIFWMAAVMLEWRERGASELALWHYIAHQADPPTESEDERVAIMGKRLTEMWQQFWGDGAPTEPPLDMSEHLQSVADNGDEQEQDR